MRKCDVDSPDKALAFMVDCTLATVEAMALIKSRKKGEYSRQIKIAQSGVDWIKSMGVDRNYMHRKEVFDFPSVQDWAKFVEGIAS